MSVTVLTRELVLRHKATLDKYISYAIANAYMTDAEASELCAYFPAWDKLPDGFEFTKEDIEKRARVQYGGKLYVVTQPHKVQADWTPTTAVSLYEYIPYRNGYREIGEYITAENPFSENELGIDANGVIWKSLYNNNIYTPAQYVSNWEKQE